MFSKIYQSRFKYSSIINVSSDDIYIYKLPSLDYEVSDRYLLRGFVTVKKPSIVALCDYVHCKNSNYSVDGIVLACGHENVNALMKSLKKKLDEKEPDLEDIGTIIDDNSDNANDIVDDIPEDLLELENAKESFLKIS
ncbi:23704_t:CDS:2 [Gigaspora margarita]|uniref:23704_t:CDS:1 n=1 Tax=Gigaspora margarita TaxID=4874 RepID=A0ABN7VLQ4_GIGMA|nr:23704_t:CDS:2 [Gigaspora margarita]